MSKSAIEHIREFRFDHVGAIQCNNDVGSGLINLSETLRNQGSKLAKAIGLTPFSREELARACEPAAGLTRLDMLPFKLEGYEDDRR